MGDSQVKLDILIFAAHPDDAEIGMGGTIVKQVKNGQRVGICDLTQAEMSSNGDVPTRRNEAQRASHILGLSYRNNLNFADRGLYPSRELIDAVVQEIREHQPRIVMAPYWEDRHPDHVACSQIVQEAVFSAKLRKYMPDVMAWSVSELYFYFINDAYEPDFIIDITDVQADKMRALRAYESQFKAIAGAEDRVETPLTQAYLERVEARDRLLGQKRSIAYAEGFVSRLPLVLNSL